MRRGIPIYRADLLSWKSVIEGELRGESRVVSDDVIERARRFVKVEDAHRCVGGELLRRVALQLETKLDPRELRVIRDGEGKPQLIDLPGVHFNLSHSGEVILCAVDRYPVGVDVEQIREIDRDVSLSCFTESERKGLQNRTDSDYLKEFYRLWTLKESYLKAVGTGLSRDPLTVEMVPIHEENVYWKTDDETRVITSLPAPDGYAAALCAEFTGEEFDLAIIDQKPMLEMQF